MQYQSWVENIPGSIKGDALWQVQAYRLALFAGDIGWQDVCGLARDARMRGLSDQLYRSLGSISANIAEGYSRGSAKERAHFYEYALGSARESRDWYYKARHVLSADVVEHRLDLLTQVIRLLLKTVPEQRGNVMKDELVGYEA